MTAKEYMENLTYSINFQRGDIERLASLQGSYDNKINATIWPTQSQIPTAQSFVAVEEALGPALDMCFPESNGLQLIPQETDTGEEQWRNSEWALWTQLQHVMKIRDASLRSVKDCFKCSVGYGIVEPFQITPNMSAVVSAGSKKTRIITQGDPQIAIRYRYVSAGDIIPYPAGTDFNGPEATPLAFHFDPHPAWEIEAMYNAAEGTGPNMLSTFDEVKKTAAAFNRGNISDFISFAATMGGRNSVFNSRDGNAPTSAPLTIPIIKVFEQPGTEVWIVPKDHEDGIIIMKREADGLARMRNGLVKWSAWPDAKRWFPMSQPEADQTRAFAYDLWLNFFFDMMSRTKDAPRVISKSALTNGQRSLDPFEDIFVDSANAREAASYLESPRIDPNLVTMGGVLEGLGQKIQGISDFTQKNFTRGGTNAFNDLLNTAQARQRLSASILETGALTQVYEHTLAYMQDLVPEGGIDLQRPIYDADQSRTLLERKTITQEDLRHSFTINIDTAERRMLGGMSDQSRFQYWQALVDREDVRKDEVNKLFPLPDTAIRRIFRGKAELDKQQALDREVRLTSELSGAAGGGGAPASTGAEQTALPQAGATEL